MVNSGILRLAACITVLLSVMEYTSARNYYSGGGGVFRCHNGQTIDNRYVCDGICDCGDSSDENNCGGHGTTINTGIFGFNQRLDAQCRVQLVNSTITKTDTLTATVTVNTTATTTSTKTCIASINSTFLASSITVFTQTNQFITHKSFSGNFASGDTTCTILLTAANIPAGGFTPFLSVVTTTASVVFVRSCIASTSCPSH